MDGRKIGRRKMTKKIRVCYSTNWMGPVSIDWYRDRGLTKRVSSILEKDSPITGRKKGDVFEYDEITESYSAGRIDFWNPYNDSMYSDELGVPPMRSEDWRSFGEWLNEFVTTEILSLEELVKEYEKTNPSIRWDEEPDWKQK